MLRLAMDSLMRRGEIWLMDLDPARPQSCQSAQAEQVRSVSMDRLGQAAGRVPLTHMAKLDDALRLHLQL